MQTVVTPAAAPRKPMVPAEPGSCDAHVHMVGSNEHPAKSPNAPSGQFEHWMEAFKTHMSILGLTRVVFVQSISQGTDNTITALAIRDFGRGNARGIGLVADGASEAQLDSLADAGIVGVRLNYVHGGALTWQGAVDLCERLRDRNMHLQMLIRAGQNLEDIAAAIRTLPIPVVIDHMGWPDLVKGPNSPGFSLLTDLLRDGHVWVKLTAAYRFSSLPYEAADALVASFVAANPDRCLWGSDWPYLMLDGVERPDAGDLLDAFHRAVPSHENRTRILIDNPQTLFDF